MALMVFCRDKQGVAHYKTAADVVTALASHMSKAVVTWQVYEASPQANSWIDQFYFKQWGELRGVSLGI